MTSTELVRNQMFLDHRTHTMIPLPDVAAAGNVAESRLSDPGASSTTTNQTQTQISHIISINNVECMHVVYHHQ